MVEESGIGKPPQSLPFPCFDESAVPCDRVIARPLQNLCLYPCLHSQQCTLLLKMDLAAPMLFGMTVDVC